MASSYIKLPSKGQREDPWISHNGTDPVNVETFQREYLHREYSDAQWETIISVCGSNPRTFDTTYWELVLLVGQKGGKNFVVDGIIAYTLYQLMCLRNPQEFLNISPQSDIDITNSSLVNERQAEMVFFERIKRTIRATIDPKTGDNWFDRYVGLDLREKGLGDLQKKTITFPSPGNNQSLGRVVCHSFDSSPSSPEGLIIFRAVVDEPSRANTDSKFGLATKLFNMLRGNTKASFPNGLGKLMMFSYPEQKINDLTVQRYEAGLKYPKRQFVRKFPTWVFNPTIKRSDFNDEYRDDPVEAGCRFGCEIPHNRYGFFIPYPEKIKECFSKDMFSPLSYKPGTTRRHTIGGRSRVYHEYTSVEILGEIVGDKRERFWGGDAGISKDVFVLVGGYAQPLEQPSSFKIEDPYGKAKEDYKDQKAKPEEVVLFSKPIIDIIIKWTPEPKKPVDFVNVGDIIQVVIEKFPHTRGFRFDHFESEKIIQEIQAKGIKADAVFFSNRQQMRIYRILRHLVWRNEIEILWDDLAIHELEDLILVNRYKIEHPRSGCFTGDTKISLLDGREISFERLVKEHSDGTSFDVCSLSEDGRARRGKAKNPRLTHKKAKILTLTLGSGETVRCTKNHRFVVADGEPWSRKYVEAQHLRPGNRLRALYEHVCFGKKIVKIEDGGYEDVYDIEVDKYHNFALSAGVFVHNSKDVSDSIANCVAQISEFSYQSSMFSDSGEDFEKEMKELRQWLLWFRRKHKRDPNMVETATHFRINPMVAEEMLATIQSEIDLGLFMGVESEMMVGVPMGDVEGSGGDLGMI